MSGTRTGGQMAADTNRKLYGSDFYAKIGASGGRKGRTGGFYGNREAARLAGAKGGKKSRRGISKDPLVQARIDARKAAVAAAKAEYLRTLDELDQARLVARMELEGKLGATA